MNNEVKITDYYHHLDLLLNELKVTSSLLSYHQEKGREEGILDSLESKILSRYLKLLMIYYLIEHKR